MVLAPAVEVAVAAALVAEEEDGARAAQASKANHRLRQRPQNPQPPGRSNRRLRSLAVVGGHSAAGADLAFLRATTA